MKEYKQKWVKFCKEISGLSEGAFEVYLQYHPELWNELKQIRMVKR